MGLYIWLVGVLIAFVLIAGFYSIWDSGTSGMPTKWSLVLLAQIALIALVWPFALVGLLTILGLVGLSKLSGGD